MGSKKISEEIKFKRKIVRATTVIKKNLIAKNDKQHTYG